MSGTPLPKRNIVVHHTAESIDPLVAMLPSVQGRKGWYVRHQGGCLIRVDGPYATREQAKIAAAAGRAE